MDADVAHPSLPDVLGLPETRGLLDVLVSGDDLRAVLLRTNVEKLSIFPSGTPHPRATELLASDAMRDLLRSVAEDFDYVLVDAPSPLEVSDVMPRSKSVGV